jgi:uncharacterized membrane protein required for colicin V production
MMTDNIAFILSFLFLIHGASRGFILSLMVPFSIIVATIISIVYYQITKDMIVTLALGLIGPFLLHFLLKLLMKTLAKAGNVDIKPGFLSRLGGAILTFAWGWVFIFFTLILLAALPPWGKFLTDVHNDVTQSVSYSLAKPWGEDFFAAPKQNQPAIANTPSSNDAQSLAEDPRFQAVLQDPEIQKEIDAHDIVKLMSNPKMIDLTQQILRDPATMKKIMSIYSRQEKPQSWVTSGSSNYKTSAN